jgi:hypothetical protein
MLVAAVLLGGTTVLADTTYHGLLTATPDDGTGMWVNDPGGDDWFPAEIEWWVNETEAGFYHYQYEIRVYGGAVSHFILETSEPLPDGDIWDITGNYGEALVGEWFYPGTANADMPGDLYGAKFDDTWGTTFTLEFTSNRLPVWGDFYAKDGTVGGEGLNQFWNAGFLLDDPLFPPSNGSLDGHILRPDSRIPEPTTVVLLTVGLMSLGVAVRRRKRDE